MAAAWSNRTFLHALWPRAQTFIGRRAFQFQYRLLRMYLRYLAGRLVPLVICRGFLMGSLATGIADSPDVPEYVALGEGISVWYPAQVWEGDLSGCSLIVGSDERLGDDREAQNAALMNAPVAFTGGVLVSPAAVSISDSNPRVVGPCGTANDTNEWVPAEETIEEAASIDADAVRRYLYALATSEAGFLVVKGVAAFALSVGATAKPIGRVGAAGLPLADTALGDLTLRANGTNALHWGSASANCGLSEGDVTRYASLKRKPQIFEHEAFRNAVLGKPSGVVTIEHRRRTLTAVEAALKSFHTGSIASVSTQTGN